MDGEDVGGADKGKNVESKSVKLCRFVYKF